MEPSHLWLTIKGCCAAILLVGCLLGGGSGSFLQAQTVNVSVWPTELDHSLESVLVFQSQSREKTEAKIQVYDGIPAQQIDEIGQAAPLRASATGEEAGATPSVDQEADTLIVNPLQSGAHAIRSTPSSNLDFLLMTQFSRAVKPEAYRIACGVTGSDDLESLAFRNPDGTYVLLTVNHSESPVSLEAFWKNRMFTYTQAGRSVGFFAWDPRSPLVSLIPRERRVSAKGSVSIEAKCSRASPLGIDLRCESPLSSCSIFPVRFLCIARPGSVMLNVTVDPDGGKNTDPGKPGFVTITATPDVGVSTSLRVPCCSATP